MSQSTPQFQKRQQLRALVPPAQTPLTAQTTETATAVSAVQAPQTNTNRLSPSSRQGSPSSWRGSAHSSPKHLSPKAQTVRSKAQSTASDTGNVSPSGRSPIQPSPEGSGSGTAAWGSYTRAKTASLSVPTSPTPKPTKPPRSPSNHSILFLNNEVPRTPIPVLSSINVCNRDLHPAGTVQTGENFGSLAKSSFGNTRQ